MSGFSISEIQSFCAQYYGGKQLLITPYGYETVYASLAQNASATNVVNIAANADFVILGFRTRAQISAAQTVSTKTAPFLRLLVVDSGSNEQYTAQTVDINNYASNDAKDIFLDYPRIVSGRSTLSLTLSNFAPTAETYVNTSVFMHGVLVRAF